MTALLKICSEYWKEQSIKITNETVLNYFRKMVENRVLFKAVNSSENILKNALENGLKCIVYHVGDREKSCAAGENLVIRELFKTLDPCLEVEISYLDLSSEDLGECRDNFQIKYPSAHADAPRIQELHEKIYNCVKNFEDVEEKHKDPCVVKLVVFENTDINAGISCSRNDDGKYVNDYIVCFGDKSNRSQVVWTHELAHKLGLIHVYDPHDVMCDNFLLVMNGLMEELDRGMTSRKFGKWSRAQWRYLKKNYLF